MTSRTRLGALCGSALFLLHCGSSGDGGAPPSDGGDAGSSSDADGASSSETGGGVDAATEGGADAVGTDAGKDASTPPPPCALPAAAKVPGLDPKFAVGARPLVTDEMSVSAAHAILDAKGRYVVFGYGAYYDSSGWEYAPMVHRFSATGDPDDTFSTAGHDLFNNTNYEARFTAAAWDSKGRLVIAGQARIGPAPYHEHLVVLRLLEDGSVDASFGDRTTLDSHKPGALIDLPSGCTDAMTFGLATLGEEIYVVSSCGGGSGRLVHYTKDGKPDPSFTTPIKGVGGITVAGGALYPSSYDHLYKIAADGSLDASFGTAGAFAPSGSSSILWVAPAADGTLVVAGDDGSSEATLVRIDAKGAPVPGFAYSYASYPDKVDVHGERCDGAWVLGTSISLGTQRSSTHLLASGALDPSWGTGGTSDKVALFSSSASVSLPTAYLEANGGILVSGVLSGHIWLAHLY